MTAPTVWLVAALGLVLCQAPLLAVVARAGPMDALVALQQASALTALLLAALAMGLGRPIFLDLALALALLGLGTPLAIARFLRRVR